MLHQHDGLNSDASSTRELIEKIEGTWKKLDPGRRLVYHHKNVLPEIIPDDSDFPFYVSITQRMPSGRVGFRRPSSEREWLNEIVLIPKGKVNRIAPTVKELWVEFSNNFDVESIKEDVDAEGGIKDRLKKSLSKRSRVIQKLSHG